MTSAQELYEREPEYVTHDLSVIYDHIDETDIWNYNIGKYESGMDTNADRIDIRVLKHFDFDFRRFWQLATVWFDGCPVMICQNAGREGYDHVARYITDRDKFLEMCSYIKTWIAERFEPINKTPMVRTHDLTKKCDYLTEFYGNKLDGKFERY